MNKRCILAGVLLLALAGACSRHVNYEQPYQPARSNGYDSISVIKSAIELQPPTYAAVPKRVDVNKECIKMVMAESRWRPPFAWVAPITFDTDAETIIRFEHIGSAKLFKSDVWWVELRDPAGNYIYAIYSFREDRAKQVIDALTVMMDTAKND